MENNLSQLTTKRLRLMVEEAEQALAELKDEIDRREQESQAREIDHLENHMKSAEFSVKSIRDFIRYLIEDGKK